MSEELSLVTELAIILIAAGLFTIISKALKQPIILGYIIAGFLVGPHLGLFPQFSSGSIHVWSEIGIIFLLFGLGLEFSFKKLLKVGSSAVLIAGVKCIGMMIVGVLAGNAMGWTFMESIFLGGLLSMSSTTIIIKTYDDLKLKQKPYATLIFGSLVVEDLIAVLLLVLLSTLAVSNSLAGTEMILAILKLIIFIVLSFVIGIYAIPTFFKKAKRFISEEILLIVSIGLCFLMVWVANLAGFSSALGAFLMGSILSETFEGEKIEKLTSNIKDLFAAVFFVSVGMMLDPALVAEHWLPILIITIITIVGILLCSTTGALLAGQGLQTAVHAGFSLAQLGEFAFIIAGLGCSLGVMREFIYPVIIAVSVITTFTTPYMIKAADPVSAWLHRHLPARFLSLISPNQKLNNSDNNGEKALWGSFLKSYFTRISLYFVVLLSITVASAALLDKAILAISPGISPGALKWISLVLELAIMSPFLIGIAIVNSNNMVKCSKGLLKSKSSNVWAMMGLLTLRVSLAVLFVVIVVARHFDFTWQSIILVIVAASSIFFLSKFVIKRTAGIEARFLKNLNQKEIAERKKKIVKSSIDDKLSGYDVNICAVQVSADFAYIGAKLSDMPFRRESGVNIIKIGRGSRSILVPDGQECIYPGDRLVAVGTNEQLSAFRTIMEESTLAYEKPNEEDFVVDVVDISSDSILCGMSLKDSNLRSVGCMVISVLHEGVLQTNPRPDYRFTEGDRVWLAGERHTVDIYKG